MIDKVIHWAKNEKPIRAIILVGSRTRDEPADLLSDYDLSIFSQEDVLYSHDDQWLSKIGNVWVCIHEKVYFENREIPTRLVIFEGGFKVDFSFFPLDILQKLAGSSSLPPEYDMGYTILLDKDAITGKMSKPSFKGYPISKPTEQDFFHVIKEFWFEVYHVAVYLKRGDLWSAKVRVDGIHHNFLLKMIEWNELSKHDWNCVIPPMGKKMQSWACEKTLDALHRIFAHFDEKDSWKALFNIMELFRDLSKETARKLGFSYSEGIDHHISTYILNLRG